MIFLNKDFVHFHVHSSYSQFDGLAQVPELVMQARKMGFSALALTDHGNVMGWIKFLKNCRATTDKKGKEIPYPIIKPILGVEMYLARYLDIGQNDDKKNITKIKNLQPDGRRGNRHINLYAMNFEGYKNICRMSHKSYVDGFYFDPRIDIETLANHSSGVMVGSACLSSIINVNLIYGRYDCAKKICSIFKDIFKDNFFLEIMYHGIKEEKEIIPSILKLSSEMCIPVIATNDSHYIIDKHGKAQELLMCMSQQRCIKDPSRLKFNHMEFYLKSAEEMSRMFKYIPNCFHNSLAMSEKIDSHDIERNLFGGMKLPKFKVPEEYSSSYDYLCKLAWEGMKRIGWSNSSKHIEALKIELNDVLVAQENNNYDFSTYFLIVRDYIQYARDNNILTGAGRGSGYASVLLRCLGITYGVDPIEHNLLWQRFLGFDDLKFIKSNDFGFEQDTGPMIIDDSSDEESEAEDLGGINRY